MRRPRSTCQDIISIVPPPLLCEALPFFTRGTSHLLEELCKATCEPTIDEAVHECFLGVEASPILDSRWKRKAIVVMIRGFCQW